MDRNMVKKYALVALIGAGAFFGARWGFDIYLDHKFLHQVRINTEQNEAVQRAKQLLREGK